MEGERGGGERGGKESERGEMVRLWWMREVMVKEE